MFPHLLVLLHSDMREFKIQIDVVPTAVTYMKDLVDSGSSFYKSKGSTPNRVETVNDKFENVKVAVVYTQDWV
jgi:hypothetical protein